MPSTTQRKVTFCSAWGLGEGVEGADGMGCKGGMGSEPTIWGVWGGWGIVVLVIIDYWDSTCSNRQVLKNQGLLEFFNGSGFNDNNSAQDKSQQKNKQQTKKAGNPPVKKKIK